MESTHPFIALYKKRSFGEKMSATFDLIKYGRKPLLKYLIYLLLPVSIVQAICMMQLMNIENFDVNDYADSIQMLTAMVGSYGLSYFFLMLTSVVGALLLMALVYALVKCYTQPHEAEAACPNIGSLLSKNFKRLVILTLFSILVGVIYTILLAMLVYLSYYTLALIIPLTLVLCVPLGLFVPIYLFEEIGIWRAFIKSFRIGFPTWGGTFLLAFINSIIGGIISVVIGLPYIVIYMVRSLLINSSEGGSMPLGMSVVVFVLCLIYLLGAYFSRSLVYISMGYQYGHAVEAEDGRRVEDEPEKFD